MECGEGRKGQSLLGLGDIETVLAGLQLIDGGGGYRLTGCTAGCVRGVRNKRPKGFVIGVGCGFGVGALVGVGGLPNASL